MEGIGDTIQTLEALGQDPCLQSHQSITYQEESGTGQCKFNKCKCRLGPAKLFGARPGLAAAVWTRDREGLNGNSA